APSGPNVLVVIDTASNQVVNRFSLPGYDCGTNFGLTLAPDGGHLALHCDPVLVLDTPTLNQFKQMQLSPAASDGRPIFDATGHFLLAATSTGAKKVDIATGLVVKSVN